MGPSETCFSLLLVVAAASLNCTHAVEYFVGEGNWTVPAHVDAYTQWAASKTFVAGDKLVFNFTAGDAVAQVAQSEYDTCTLGYVNATIMEPPPVIFALDIAGEYYFICPFDSHCIRGQKLKLSVNVSTATSVATPTPTPSPLPVRKFKIWLKLIIGSAASGSLLLLIFIFCFIRKRQSRNIIPLWKKPNNSRNVEKFLKIYETQTPKRYSYPDIMKMTNFLKNKLGQGGCGSVFKGQLLDGRLVAVKILTNSEGKGEDFMNEVAAIGTTAHLNIVRLLGFCSEGTKRALIYDFMPNGSLEKFIFVENKKNRPLGWEVLFQIALGIARGLEYLHRGCNKRILHFDIKPHNILLDQDFCPKISDFGLAKLCLDKQSIVSMTVARGTLGYIAPEVIYRSLGGVSQKSDVYSYGMLLLEMVGGRKNIDDQVENTSELYFPDWIYNRINKQGGLQLDEFKAETDDEIARKLILVGLWCIQTKPADRPTMSKVVELLEGNLEALQMPPKPVLSSLWVPDAVCTDIEMISSSS